MFLVLLGVVGILPMYRPRMGGGEQFIGKRCFYDPVKHSRWSSSAGVVNGLGGLTIFARKALLQMFGRIPGVPPIDVM